MPRRLERLYMDNTYINKNVYRSYYSNIMKNAILNSIKSFVRNTRKLKNKKNVQFKSKNRRYVLTSNGFLYVKPSNTRNTRKLSNAMVGAYYNTAHNNLIPNFIRVKRQT